MVKALSTLVSEDGNDPAIDGWFEHVKPLTARQKQIIAEHVAHTNEADVKKTAGRAALGARSVVPRRAGAARLAADRQYRGHVSPATPAPAARPFCRSKAAAKLDFRLVPDQTAADAQPSSRRISPSAATATSRSRSPAATIRPRPTRIHRSSRHRRPFTNTSACRSSLSPRLAGSWPGYIFTGPPVNLPAGHFGTGHGSRAHAPDEYYVIESSNPAVQGMADATLSYVMHLYALAAV